MLNKTLIGRGRLKKQKKKNIFFKFGKLFPVCHNNMKSNICIVFSWRTPVIWTLAFLQ